MPDGPAGGGPLRSSLRLSGAGRALLMAGAAFLTAGVLARAWPLAVWGALMLGLLLLARQHGGRLAHWLREGRLRFALHQLPPRIRPPLRVGLPFPLELHATSPWHPSLRGALLLATSHGLEPTPGGPLQLRLPPGAWRIPLTVLPRRLGTAAIQGLQLEAHVGLGLFQAEAYWPFEQRLLLLEGHPRPVRPRGNAVRRPLPDRTGSHRLWQAGLGSEFRELREHRPGDPFRSIEWKASARHRRLMVREVESEVVLTLTILLDISPSMRQGAAGQSALDHCQRLILEVARSGQAARDRLGLITYDQRVHGDLPAAGTLRQLRDITDHLARLGEVFDPDLTRAQEPLELATYLARELHRRYGLTLNPWELLGPELPVSPGGQGVEALLAALPGRAAQGLVEPGLAMTEGEHRLRDLCQALALQLPYRPREQPTDWAQGLAEALRRVVVRSHGGHQVLILSDLAGEELDETLPRTVRLVRARHLRITVAQLPWSGTDPAQASPLERLVAGDDRRRNRGAELLAGLGLPILRLRPDARGDRLLQQLRRRQWG